MADEKISAMMAYTGSPGAAAHHVVAPVILSSVVNNYGMDARDLVMSNVRGVKITTVAGTRTISPAQASVFYCVSSGGNAVNTVKIGALSATPYGYHAGYNGRKFTVGFYTRTSAGDKIKIVSPSLGGFYLKPSAKFAGLQYCAAVYLTNAKQYAVFEFENGYVRWDYDASYGIVIGSQGTWSNHTPTADPGHSGMIWRDVATGIIHQHP